MKIRFLFYIAVSTFACCESQATDVDDYDIFKTTMRLPDFSLVKPVMSKSRLTPSPKNLKISMAKELEDQEIRNYAKQASVADLIRLAGYVSSTSRTIHDGYFHPFPQGEIRKLDKLEEAVLKCSDLYGQDDYTTRKLRDAALLHETLKDDNSTRAKMNGQSSNAWQARNCNPFVEKSFRGSSRG